MNSIEIKNMTKKFPSGVVANDNVSLSVKKGEIHAILGENGAGKSTMMSVLFGLLKHDSGTIKINGKSVVLKTPRDAVKAGVAMLPQHFKLMDSLPVWRNVILGYERVQHGFILDKNKTIAELDSIAQKHHITLDWNEKVHKLSTSDKQKVELMKILWTKVNILIFDEPTSILTPDQITEFLRMCKQFKKEGKTIVIITHKLDEIKEIADTCTIMRKGKTVKAVSVKSTSEEQLVKMMVGEEVDLDLKTIKKSPVKKEVALTVSNLSYRSKTVSDKSINDISFEIKKGEILGVAAIEGNGQSELFKILGGLLKRTDGHIKFHGENMEKMTPDILYKRKLVAHIPEDRHANGLVLDQKCSYNAILEEVDQFTKFGFLQNNKIETYLEELIKEYKIVGIQNVKKTLAKSLSGGNQQKLIIAREIERGNSVILAKHPTRGLDVGAIRNVYQNLIDARNKGAAVLLSSGELDEIISISDRIAVMHQGKIVATMSAKQADKIKIGKLMAGGK